MAVIKEWCCIVHGYFEGSHPICPSNNCDSEEVTQVLLTAPKIGSAATKRFDVGMRKSSDMMGINNWKSSRREGDVSFAGRSADMPRGALGSEVLWGTDAVTRALGRPFADLLQIAAKPAVSADGRVLSNINNPLPELQASSPKLASPLPRAGEVRPNPDDGPSSAAKARSLL